MTSEPERWIPVDRDVVELSSWTVRAQPALIADLPIEIVETRPAAPAWYTDGLIEPTLRRRRGRRRPPALTLAAWLGVAVLLAGIGAGGAFLARGAGTAGSRPPAGTNTAAAPAAVAVLAPSGERYVCTIVGTPAAEELEGGDENDVICGLGGDDTIDGGGGDDILLGGVGDDVIVGGPGEDELYGEGGDDRLEARDGSRDLLDGGPGRDHVDAGWLDEATGEESRSDPVLAAAGDIACDPLADSFNSGVGTELFCRQGHTAEIVLGLEPDAVLALGDIQNSNGSYSKYQRSYDKSWGGVKPVTHPTPGTEHDRFGKGGYRRYWGEQAGPPDRLYYSFNVGAWHVVSLNSNCVEVGGCEPGSPQEQWLRADLADNPARCTLGFWHEPFYSSSGRHPDTAPLWQTLLDHGAELVLSGDSQNYERFLPMTADGVVDRADGIRQFVVGTGGERLTSFGEPAPGSVARIDETFGILKLTLHRAGYDWRFLPETSGARGDAGTASCH